MTTVSPASTSLPLGKVLASTEKKTRDKAIKNLSIFLSQSGENAISKPDMDKLWKGIFYCFWMSDKPLVQQGLATELAELLLTIPSNTESLAFLRGFWEAVVREWNGIDSFRLDKYYMLVRRFVNASFRLLLREKWEPSIYQEYVAIMTNVGGPLCPSDIKAPTSLSYHVADVYLEELEKVSSRTAEIESQQPIPLLLILEPFFIQSAQTTSKLCFKRIYSSVWQPLLDALSTSLEDDEEESRPRKRARLYQDSPLSALKKNACLRDPNAEIPLAPADLLKQLRRAFFDVASRPATRDSSRRKLYALYKEGDGASDEEN